MNQKTHALHASTRDLRLFIKTEDNFGLCVPLEKTAKENA
jgi:hypothetical protein